MKYTCPKPNCTFTSNDHDNIREILAHEKTHKKAETTIGTRIIKDKCEHCDGKGYIENAYMVDISDVPKTD